MAIYYTCFGVQKIQPSTFHMTHKFLGAQDARSLEGIRRIVKNYFEPQVIKIPEIRFNRLDFLGPDYTPAMCIADTGQKRHLLLDLRKALDVFRKDDFECWTPHISKISFTDITVNFDSYFIMKDSTILERFEIA